MTLTLVIIYKRCDGAFKRNVADIDLMLSGDVPLYVMEKTRSAKSRCWTVSVHVLCVLLSRYRADIKNKSEQSGYKCPQESWSWTVLSRGMKEGRKESRF